MSSLILLLKGEGYTLLVEERNEKQEFLHLVRDRINFLSEKQMLETSSEGIILQPAITISLELKEETLASGSRMTAGYLSPSVQRFSLCSENV